jgi:hypothetical protein
MGAFLSLFLCLFCMLKEVSFLCRGSGNYNLEEKIQCAWQIVLGLLGFFYFFWCASEVFNSSLSFSSHFLALVESPHIFLGGIDWR